MVAMITWFICCLIFFGGLGTMLAYIDRGVWLICGWGLGLFFAIPPAFCFLVVSACGYPILQRMFDEFVYGFTQGLRGRRLGRK